MDDETKNGYIATIAVAFLGIILLGLSFENGFSQAWTNGVTRVWLIAGIIFTGAGITGFFKPEVASILVHWIRNMQEAQAREERNEKRRQTVQKNKQKQNRTKNSNQFGNINGKNISINVTSGDNRSSKKKKST